MYLTTGVDVPGFENDLGLDFHQGVGGRMHVRCSAEGEKNNLKQNDC